jgi:hypothetical protein
MGVLATMYSVPPALMEKIREDEALLAIVFGDEESDDEAWKVDSKDFDKHYREAIDILFQDHDELREALAIENEHTDGLHCDPYDLCVILPRTVTKMVAALEGATMDALKAGGLAKELTDYDAKPIREEEYEGLAGDLDAMRAFLARAAAEGHTLIVAEA